MFVKKNLLFIVLSTALFSDSLKLDYSYGVHDFVVQQNMHTRGINAGIYATYTPVKNVYHYGSFEVFAEHDKSDQDPDHIPIWFRANYMLENRLFQSKDDHFYFNSLVDIDWKMNTVSSVEQYLKTGIGFEFVFQEDNVALTYKIMGGMYYLEIDDDVPKEFGFTREDLDVGYKASIVYSANMKWKISGKSLMFLEYEEWNEKGKWLERSTKLSAIYSKTEDVNIVVSAEKTIYNLSNFRQYGVDILPWNQDILFKVVIQIPFPW